jgi:nucleotide-binding universal stress UspA family protein
MPPGIQTIVCAVDFSTFSALVVARGVELARRAGAHLHLAHAVHIPQDDLHPTARLEQGGDRAALMETARRRMADLMGGADLAWTGTVVFGDPVAEISALVKKLPPCLVVSASHGLSGIRRLFLGTVVERLTRALDRPMLVVKPATAGSPVKAGAQVRAGARVTRDPRRRATAFHSVLIGCDLYGHWHQAASLLPLLLGTPDAGLHLLHVMEDPLESAPREADDRPYGQFQQEQQTHIQEELAAQVARLLPGTGPPSFSIEVTPGVPEEMLLGVARQRGCDLIIVGVRASGKFERWIAGSTTEALLRHSPCAVLTLPQTHPDAAAGDTAR